MPFCVVVLADIELSALPPVTFAEDTVVVRGTPGVAELNSMLPRATVALTSPDKSASLLILAANEVVSSAWVVSVTLTV